MKVTIMWFCFSEALSWLMEEDWEGEGTVAELLEEELPLVTEELEEDDREAVKRYLGLEQAG